MIYTSQYRDVCRWLYLLNCAFNHFRLHNLQLLVAVYLCKIGTGIAQVFAGVSGYEFVRTIVLSQAQTLYNYTAW